MKLSFTKIFILFFLPSLLSAQSKNVWQTPMAHPEMNFYEIQKEFYKHWKHHEKELLEEKEERTKKGATETGKKIENEAEESGYLQFKRWENYMEPRVYPDGNITEPSYKWNYFQDYLNANPAAMEMYNRNQQQNNGIESVVSSTWTFVGPTGAPSSSGAGRLNFVRFDPTNSSTMYVGGPDGGLWKSTNGGGSFTTNTDFLTVIGVTDVAIDPGNTQIMYLATGDGDAGDSYSIGVLKSTNGGTSWNTSGLTWTVTQGRTISKLLMDPGNSSILIAATSNGIYRTTNAGANWTQVSTANVQDMEFKSGDSQIVFATGTRYYRSTNNGASWTNITSGLPASTAVDRMAVGVTAANANYVYILASDNNGSGFYGFYRSTDGGTTFSTRSTTPNILGWESDGSDSDGQGWYDLALGVSPTAADVVFVGGINIWKSTTGGTSWALNADWTGQAQDYVHADIHWIEFLPGSGTTLYATCDGGIHRSTNTGTAWTDISSNVSVAQIYRIGMSALTQNLFITGHQDCGTNKWNGTAYTGIEGGDGMDCFIDRTNDLTMYCSFPGGSFERSTNGGSTWAPADAGTPAGPWLTCFSQDPTTANTLWAGFTKMYKSTNQGTSWTGMGNMPTTSGSIVDFKVAPSNNQIIYAAKSTNIAKSTNGGTSWTSITGTLPVSTENITRIAVKSTDPNVLWVSFSGYTSTAKVYKSTNAGSTWTNISTGLPNLPVNCVMYGTGLNNDAVYAGCDVGVYFIDNTFSTWQPYFAGIPHSEVNDLEIYPSTGKIRAATFGRGVWEVDAYVMASAPPSAQFSPSSSTACVGIPINFTDQSTGVPNTWAWTFQGAGTGSSSTQNPTGISWSSAGTYTVTLIASNAFGNDTVTQTITVISSPIVNASVAQSPICNGQATTLSATNATTYLWTPGGSTNASINVSPSSTTTYTVTGTTSGCSGTASVTVVVNPLPTITVSPSPSSVCQGGSSTLNATGAGTISWSPGGFTGTSITVNPSATTTYTASGTDANGCTGTGTGTVTVHPTPTVSATASDPGICTDSSTVLTATGTAGNTYAWSPGGMTGTSTTVSPSSTTTYTVTATSTNGCTNTNTVVVTVLPVPPTPSFTANGNVLTASQSGSSYQWYNNGVLISGANQQSYTITQSGNYSVVVFDANGCPSPQSNFTLITGISPNNTTGINISVFPNPNEGHFTLFVNGPASNQILVSLHNMEGRLIVEEKINDFPGTVSKPFDLSQYGKGVYLITISSDKGTVTKEVVIQ